MICKVFPHETFLTRQNDFTLYKFRIEEHVYAGCNSVYPPEMRFKEIELSGATMGIFGFGGTGRAVARRAAAFGMNCIALDRDQVPLSEEVSDIYVPDRFEEFLASSDVLSICCPLTNETRDLFDESAFDAMKDSAFLVNVTRGEVMVEEDLVKALQTNKIGGARRNSSSCFTFRIKFRILRAGASRNISPPPALNAKIESTSHKP